MMFVPSLIIFYTPKVFFLLLQFLQLQTMFEKRVFYTVNNSRKKIFVGSVLS